MKDELERLSNMKDTYEKQIIKLKEEWENGSSRFDKIKDYQIQLNIWVNRVAQYEEQISKLRRSK